MKDYKLICFDVDGTLITSKSGATFRRDNAKKTPTGQLSTIINIIL
jgi:hydroxymethylpyrimidine pyrophosphatase-like HAD family hydrolase